MLLSFCIVLTQERITFHYSLLGDSNVEGSFYFFEGGLNINVAFRIRKNGGLGLDCSRLGENNLG